MDTMKLKKIMKSLDNSLAAATFAEEGEAGIAQSMLKDGRGVLLALKEGRIDAKTLKYALNTALRIGANLDILYVTSDDQDEVINEPALSAFEKELIEGNVKHRLIQRTGCLKQQIIDYTNREKEILFAVIESPGSLDEDCNKKDKTLADLWQQLKCPLVVVMDQAKA
jgi:hypothetical protein